ncbi:arylesterase [Marinobacterium sp. D7]|nr:arylesterase [Marinobacterium ramblicola]
MKTRIALKALPIPTLLLACLFWLQGCADDKLSPLSQEATILAFGDSLTAGYGADEADSYPQVLAQLSGRRVVNAGVSGEVTSQGLQRLATVLEQERPALMILLEGGNDILRNLDQEHTRDNLQQMIELARDKGVEVVLVSVPRKNLFSDAAPFYAELAERYGLPFAESTVAELLRSPRYKSDQVHFNAEGYRRLAQSLYELLKEEGAL